MSDNNKWMKMVGHMGCISPCSGHPVLRTKQGKVWVAAHKLSRYLQCSGCGYAPLPKLQLSLIPKFIYYQKKTKKIFKHKMTTRLGYWWNGKKTLGWFVEEMGMGWSGTAVFDGKWIHATVCSSGRSLIGLSYNQAKSKAVQTLKDQIQKKQSTGEKQCQINQ